MSDMGTDFTLNRAQAALLSRDFTLAARLFKTALKEHPNDVKILSDLASCFVRANQDGKALSAYIDVLAVDPKNFNALNSLGGIYRRLGQYDDSIKVLEKALATGINNEAVNYNMGHTYKLMGKYDAAAECFDSVIEENPNDVLAYNHLGSIYALRGEHLKALQIYWRALQIDGNHPVLHFNSAISFMSLGKYEEAEKAYANVLRTKPGWVDAIEGYAELLQKQHKLKEAENVVTKALVINPESVSLHNVLGSIYESRGDYSSAEKEYNTVLKLDDKNVASMTGLSNIYQLQGRNTEALELIEKLEVLNKGQKSVGVRHGKLLINQSRLQEAAEKIHDLRIAYPNDIDVLSLLAQFFIKAGNSKKANGCYKKISEINPNCASYIKDSAEQYINIGKFKEAEHFLEKYLEKRPHDSQALCLLGLNYERQEKYEAAISAYQLALEEDEDNTVALAGITRLANAMKNDSHSMALISDILSTYSKDSNPDAIQESIKMYEETVQKVIDDVPEVTNESIEDVDLSFTEDIDSVEDMNLDELIQLEVNPEEMPFDDIDPLVLDMPVDDEITPPELDHSFTDLTDLLPDDIPMDDIPEKETFDNFDPFDVPQTTQRDPIENQEYLDVDGTMALEEEDLYDDSEDEKPVNVVDAKDVLEAKIEEKETPPAPPAPPAPQQMYYPPQPNYPPQTDFPPQFEKNKVPEKPLAFKDELIEDDFEPVEEEEQIQDLEVSPDDLFDDIQSVDDEESESIEDSEELEDSTEAEEELGFDDEEFENIEDSEEVADNEVPFVDFDVEPVLEEELNQEIEDSFEESELDTEPVFQEEIEDEMGLDSKEFENLDDEETENSENSKEEDSLSLQEENDELDDLDLLSTNPDPEIATMETVSAILQRVLRTPVRPQFRNTAEMFNDLRDLCTWLPDQKKDKFVTSLDRLKLDYVINRLMGKPGLLAAAGAIRTTSGFVVDEKKEKPSLLKTMCYMRNLVSALPDNNQAKALEREITETVIPGLSLHE